MLSTYLWLLVLSFYDYPSSKQQPVVIQANCVRLGCYKKDKETAGWTPRLPVHAFYGPPNQSKRQGDCSHKEDHSQVLPSLPTQGDSQRYSWSRLLELREISLLHFYSSITVNGPKFSSHPWHTQPRHFSFLCALNVSGCLSSGKPPYPSLFK